MESAVHANRHLPGHLGSLTAPEGGWLAVGCRVASVGRAAAALADPVAQGNTEHGPPGGRGAARHSLVLLGFGRERATQRSEVARALETKFLRFETRQEQDSVLSLPRSTGSVPAALPKRRSRTSRFSA